MTISIVQVKTAGITGGTTLSLTLNSPATAGNCLLAIATGGATTGVTGITIGGSADNWAQQAGNVGYDPQPLDIWADPACAGGQTGIVISFGQNDPAGAIVLEVSGLAATSAALADLNIVNEVDGSSGSWTSGSTGTTTQASELWIGAVTGYNYSGGPVTVTGPGAPWVNETQVTTSPGSFLYAGYQIASAAGQASYSGTVTGISDHNLYYQAITVTFKAAAGAAGSVTLAPLKVTGAASSGSDFSTGAVALPALAVTGSSGEVSNAAALIALPSLNVITPGAITATGNVTLPPLSQASVIGYQPAPLYNLCVNPSFEAGTEGWVPLLGAAITQTGVTAYSGRYCGMVTTDGLQQGEGVIGPQGYLLPYASAASAQLQIAGESGQVLVTFASNPDGIILGQQVMQLENDWQQVLFAGGSVAYGDPMFVVIETTGSAQAITFYIDAVSYEPTAAPDPYFDGDSPGAFWLGATGLSASELPVQGTLSVHGGMYMLGTAKLINEGEIFTVAVANVQATMTGTIAAVTGTSPVAALDDFASWITGTDNDPAMTYCSWNTQGLLSGQTDYTRPWGIFYPPLDYPDSTGANLWNRAAFAAVGFEFASVAAGAAQNITCAQLEMMPLAGTTSLDQTPGPSAYDASRTLHTTVKPTRLNYAQNPAFQVSGSAWNGSGNGVLSYDPTVIYPLGGDYDGQAVSTLTQSGKVTIPTGNGGATQTLSGLFTGDTYIASMYVLPGPGILDFQLSTGRAVSSSVATGADLNPAVPAVLPPNEYGNSGVTYYVSATGYDTSNGLSPQAAFATIGRCNALTLHPGDAILFEGGFTFSDAQLTLTWAGTELNPVIIGSWGTGYATLAYSGNHCIYGVNVGGYLITNLNITGPGGTPAYCGVRFHCSGGGQLPRVIVTSCEITGWMYGCQLDGVNTNDGWLGIYITGCGITSCYHGGIDVRGPTFSPSAPSWCHQDVRVENCTLANHPGAASVTAFATGHGCHLHSVSGGHVSGCSVSGNGGSNGCTTDGPAGIRLTACNNVTPHDNVCYNNATGTSYGGDGCRVDAGCTGCIAERNICHENYGGGISCTGGSTDSYWGSVVPNTVRYNICWGNGKNGAVNANYYGEFTCTGNLYGLQCHANTFVSYAGSGSQVPVPFCVPVASIFSGCHAWNNIFYQNGFGAVLHHFAAYSQAQFQFQGNIYWSLGTFAIFWGSSYASLAVWQAASGQEFLNGAACGFQADPRLAAPHQAPAVITPLDLMPAFGMQVLAESPCIQRGLDLYHLYAVSAGPADALGNQIPVNATPWIGAVQGFPVAPAGGWMRLQVIFTAPAPSATLTVTAITDPAASFPVTFNCGPALAEAGETTGSYFDGSFTGPDYMWETGSTPGIGRSYYYENYKIQQSVVLDILGRHTPLGLSWVQPIYAQLPAQ